MFRKILFTLLACGFVYGTESFEKLSPGAFTSGSVEYGEMVAEAGHAEVMSRGRTGRLALRLLGGEGKSAELKLSKKLVKDTGFVFWFERWTKKEPFRLVVTALTPQGEKEVTVLDKAGTGGFSNKVAGSLPAGTTGMRITATTPAGAGVILDDLMLMVGKMQVSSVSATNPGVWPLMKRASFNPAVRLFVETSGVKRWIPWR